MSELPLMKCTGCGVCVQLCSKKAVSLCENHEGFLYSKVDDKLCVNCGLCEKNCPVNQSKNNAEKYSEKESFACIANDEKIREESSSGGMFSVLAERIIAEGGVVFGAEFDKDFSVKFGWTNSSEGLERFRGSKYLQARTEDSFCECKKILKDGRKVLFTGTPCQIAGLKAFLKKNYENLYTIDFICHGVPSPKLWQKYIKYREKKSASRTVKTAFRRKNDGWKLFSLSFTFANDSEYRQPLTKDKYLQIFLKDNALRESCYRCTFRGDNHKSDLTIADFWGIEAVYPEFFDDRGTSLLIVQNEKEKKLFDLCKDECRLSQVDFDKAVSFNPSYFKSPVRKGKRNAFYKDFEKRGIDYLYRRFGRESLFSRFKHFIKRCLRFGKRVFIKLREGLEHLRSSPEGMSGG